MRSLALVTAILISSSVAHAERERVWWLVGMFAGTAYADQTQNDPFPNGGARLMLSFEDAPLRADPAHHVSHELRLVPELFAGFYLDNIRLRAQVGAGLRGELQLAQGGANNPLPDMTGVIYAAVRAKLSGPDASGGGEGIIGTYVITPRGYRIGIEGGLGVLARADLTAAETPELEALASVYVGWAR